MYFNNNNNNKSYSKGHEVRGRRISTQKFTKSAMTLVTLATTLSKYAAKDDCKGLNNTISNQPFFASNNRDSFARQQH